MQKSESLSAAEVANYPLACREAFLAETRRLPTASPGLRAYFILPEIDSILDNFNLWLECFGD